MSVKVAVRVRPFNQRQKFLGCLNCIQMKDKTTILINPRDRSQKEYQFTFDYSFWSHDGYQQLENGYLYPIDDRFIDQKKIFKYLGEDILKNAWNGFNCCLFAYGQTGAGKSYSMIGYQTNRGIVPMVCQKIFQGIQKNKIKGKNMLEIYNQKVQDLFIHTSKRPSNGLRIRESKKVGVYVQGITRYQVHSYAQIQQRMEEGAKNRSLASTLMNEYSSRAHTIVMIQFVQKQFITQQKINKKTSLLNLVDLAGSQRIAKTGISDKDRLKQASQINKSLHTLGRVIESLAQLSAGKANVQIPYRESALTRILETALGGNSVTTMICAVSPANDNYQQTLSTLRYADQTKRIKNKPIINQSAIDKIIRQLREQNERLKQMLRIAKLKGINLQDGQNGNIFANIQEIQRQIRKNMQSFAINTEGYDDEDDDQNMTIRQFVQIGDPSQFNAGQFSCDSPSNITVGATKANAFITNLSQDRLLSFKIKYSCQEQLYVGNKNLKQGGRNKLVLCGLGVQDRHARLFQINQKFYIEPLCEQACEYTLVNGRSVDKKTQIFHNDRIIFGTNSVFLFKNLNQRTKAIKKQSITQKGNQKKVNNRQSVSIGTDDNLDQSLLLDWQQQEDNKPKIKTANSISSNELQQDQNTQQSIDERLLDYEFAVNQRQNKMFQTSYSGSGLNPQSSIIVSNQMVNKLDQIEKQFEQLKKQNERKLKQKQQQFKAQLKRMELERQIQKAKLKQQLKRKQQQAKKIITQKQRIQKIRDKLLQIQRQRKQKQMNLRQSLLLGGDQDDELNKMQFQQIPFLPQQQKAISYNKKKAYEQVDPIKTNENTKGQTKIQYIDRQNFHYEFNVIHNGGTHKANEDLKPSDPSANTTSSTNNQGHHGESILLDVQQSNKEAQVSKKQKTRKNLKVQSVYNLNEAPQVKKVEKPSQIPKGTEKIQRKKSLNMTDILYDMPPRSRRNSRGSRKSSKSDEEQNLLNTTGQQVLANYLPKNQHRYSEGLENVSLNLSDDMTMHYAMREQQLLQKIKEYEQKLRSLQSSAKQKAQNIINIRKSFAVDFGEALTDENFGDEENFFQGQLDLSEIQTKNHNSGQLALAQSGQIQKKIKISMVQCQNQNIINQRSLQVRKRKREAEELKQVFIKKEKKNLQKKLVQLIPMIQKLNIWAKQMQRNIQGRIEIEYHNFTNYQIVDALKSTSPGKIQISIKILNYEEGRSYKWTVDVFKNRFQIAQGLFLKYIQNNNQDLFIDKTKDPFWDPRDFQSFAVGYLTLQSLLYQIDFEGQVSLVHKGQIVGHLDIVLEYTMDRKARKLKEKFNEQGKIQNQITDPRQLLDQDLTFTISIQTFRPTEHLPIDKIQKYYISYEIIQDSYKKQCFKTQEINIKKKQVRYMLKHTFHNVTEQTIAYLSDSPICLTLNLLYHFDEDMINMSASFINQNDSSLNMSTQSQVPTKIEGSNSSKQSPKTLMKKKSQTIIMENPDVMSKIDKQYSTQQFKKSKVRVEHNSNSNSSSSRKRDKVKQDCSVF